MSKFGFFYKKIVKILVFRPKFDRICQNLVFYLKILVFEQKNSKKFGFQVKIMSKL